MTKRPSLESTGALWMANVKEQARMTFPDFFFNKFVFYIYFSYILQSFVFFFHLFCFGISNMDEFALVDFIIILDVATNKVWDQINLIYHIQEMIIPFFFLGEQGDKLCKPRILLICMTWTMVGTWARS